MPAVYGFISNYNIIAQKSCFVKTKFLLAEKYSASKTLT